MELWHILNRGVEKRDIVIDDKDRIRFIHDLYALNDVNYARHIYQPERRNEIQYERECLVDIHAFCLMNNHYHLLLSEAHENGISLFMHKFNMGYAKYFNERYERSGYLWQGKHKKIRIVRDAHYMHIPFYIHLNPLDYEYHAWREGKVSHPEHALEYLHAYRWSSHLDYIGITNFPSITKRDDIGDLLGTPERYEKEIVRLIKNPSLAAASNMLE